MSICYLSLCKVPIYNFLYYFLCSLIFYSRNMLSSAHILAMDTKNLLDVCDSIRARFPVKDEFPDISFENKEEKQEQIYCNQVPPTIGIYDNQATIQEQLKIIEEPPESPQNNNQKVLSN